MSITLGSIESPVTISVKNLSLSNGTLIIPRGNTLYIEGRSIKFTSTCAFHVKGTTIAPLVACDFSVTLPTSQVTASILGTIVSNGYAEDVAPVDVSG